MDLHYIENVEFMDGGHGHQRVADIEHVRQWAEERGLALVPAEPTAEILEAGMAPKGYSPDGYPNGYTLKDEYRAMIAVAHDTK